MPLKLVVTIYTVFSFLISNAILAQEIDSPFTDAELDRLEQLAEQRPLTDAELEPFREIQRTRPLTEREWRVFRLESRVISDEEAKIGGKQIQWNEYLRSQNKQKYAAQAIKEEQAGALSRKRSVYKALEEKEWIELDVVLRGFADRFDTVDPQAQEKNSALFQQFIDTLPFGTYEVLDWSSQHPHEIHIHLKHNANAFYYIKDRPQVLRYFVTEYVNVDFPGFD